MELAAFVGDCCVHLQSQGVICGLIQITKYKDSKMSKILFYFKHIKMNDNFPQKEMPHEYVCTMYTDKISHSYLNNWTGPTRLTRKAMTKWFVGRVTFVIQFAHKILIY